MRNARTITALSVLAWLSLSAVATARQTALGAPKSDAKVYEVSKNYTTLSFTATKWMVFKEQGLFEDFSGPLTYSAEDPEKCKIDVTVKAASLNTRNAGRDKVLRSDDFFDVERYPTLSFHSTRVFATGKDSYDVTGDLTIHGITRQITIPVKTIGVRAIQGVGELAGFETTFTIDRRDFGILGTRWSNNPMAIDPSILIHLIIGGVPPGMRGG
jgi:polyisoprenoid-binding protein YceI